MKVVGDVDISLDANQPQKESFILRVTCLIEWRLNGLSHMMELKKIFIIFLFRKII